MAPAPMRALSIEERLAGLASRRFGRQPGGVAGEPPPYPDVERLCDEVAALREAVALAGLAMVQEAQAGRERRSGRPGDPSDHPGDAKPGDRR